MTNMCRCNDYFSDIYFDCFWRAVELAPLEGLSNLPDASSYNHDAGLPSSCVFELLA